MVAYGATVTSIFNQNLSELDCVLILALMADILIYRIGLALRWVYHSTTLSLPDGVPEGSSLEPTAVLTTKSLMFADDLKV